MPKRRTFKSNLLERLVPVLLLASILLAFAVGVLWQKVNNLEKGGGVATGAATAPSAAGQAAAAAQPTAAPVNIKDVSLSNEPFIGKADAPVTLAYWFDYQCPFCKKFEDDTLQTLIDKYVTPGKLKIVFKHFQFLGADSQTAGLAANAVWELYPGSYYKWHQAMFAKQDTENAGWGSKSDIIAMTKTIAGIDANKVSQLMDSKKDVYQKELDDDKAEGAKFNISGTPGFVIGTQNIVGAQPTSAFTAAIDAELAK